MKQTSYFRNVIEKVIVSRLFPSCGDIGILYSGLFSWVEIFVKCWIWSSELIFVVLIFVAPAFALALALVIDADDVICKLVHVHGLMAEVQFQRYCASLYSVSATLLRQ